MLDHFSILAPFYDRLIRPPDPKRLLERLNLPVKGKLLDAGGGTGRVSLALRPYVDDLYLTDSSEGMLRQARQKNSFLLSAAYTERLPYPNDFFERILVVDALHHFSNQELSISELLRVLKPGGRMVIEEPDFTRLVVKILAAAEKIALMQSRFYTPENIGEFISPHGYVPQIERDDHLNAWIVVDK